ncbi:hypothetical protein PF005_g31270 [Phytophthora fragariae]|uniref:Secreted protein n=1 Tax=Phytophthora fragariae TaxID=53985 RepID=A0A6A4D1T0_9STRA|nr:hypothetical protein PF003_g30643 [Phytophthora fragariae]KAE8918300.1 hypothetical protein PF009_g31383 [Phytophthora fragariae]KAE8959198.1 hypothetical protein PF011_g30512 [Phytophthora fragariae]KAE9058308.1 hypothetical protein PF010_g31050 [Phytophthora fragariae]KAE9059604.1 hypothetical protein PF007_g30897 [Phytophthora fragariae]
MWGTRSHLHLQPCVLGIGAACGSAVPGSLAATSSSHTWHAHRSGLHSYSTYMFTVCTDSPSCRRSPAGANHHV